MDINQTQWLRKELGLSQMNENDLNSLMFHPRHGGLCRRFLQFLAQSTLCSQKFPTVFAEEQYQTSKENLETKSNELRTEAFQLEKSINRCRNKEQELNFLKQKSQYLMELEHLYATSIVKVEKILDRPNEALEKSLETIKTSSHYLANNDIEALYIHDLKTIPRPIEPNLKAPQLRKEYSTMKTDVINMIRAVLIVMKSVQQKMSSIDWEGLEVEKRPCIEELVAFKMPKCKEILVETDEDVRKMRIENQNLINRINESEKLIVDLAQLYQTRRDGIVERFKEELRNIHRYDVDSI